MLDTSGFKSTERKEQELVQYKGQMRIVGVLKEDNTTIGYLIMVEKTYQLKPFSVEQTKELLKRFKFVNANLVDNTIENTECSMNRLLVLNSKLVPIDNIGIYIIGRIKTPQKEDSFRILDTTGKVLDVTSQELLKQLSYNPDCKLINAKQVTKQDKVYISAIKGEFTTIEKSGKKSSSTNDNTNTQEENLKQQRKQANIHRHLVNLYNSY